MKPSGMATAMAASRMQWIAKKNDPDPIIKKVQMGSCEIITWYDNRIFTDEVPPEVDWMKPDNHQSWAWCTGRQQWQYDEYYAPKTIHYKTTDYAPRESPCDVVTWLNCK